MENVSLQHKILLLGVVVRYVCGLSSRLCTLVNSSRVNVGFPMQMTLPICIIAQCNTMRCSATMWGCGGLDSVCIRST